MFRARNIQYEVSDRIQAIGYGGIGLIDSLAQQSGLIDSIDRNVHLLKFHFPYHESDHVLNIAYNAMTGGQCLEDLELKRGDEAYLDGFGTSGPLGCWRTSISLRLRCVPESQGNG